jgi:hypothetical protein
MIQYLSASLDRRIPSDYHEWLSRTPGMAAGITDHVWSFRELLTIKFEPIHNQSTSG